MAKKAKTRMSARNRPRMFPQFAPINTRFSPGSRVVISVLSLIASSDSRIEIHESSEMGNQTFVRYEVSGVRYQVSGAGAWRSVRRFCAGIRKDGRKTFNVQPFERPGSVLI